MKFTFEEKLEEKLSPEFLMSAVRNYLLKNKKIRRIYFNKLIEKENRLKKSNQSMSKNLSDTKNNYNENNMKLAELKNKNNKIIEMLLNTISY